MKAFIFDRYGNAIPTDRITRISLDATRKVRVFVDDGYEGESFEAAQDTVEAVVDAIRLAEIDAARDDEYWRCGARYAFEHGRTG